MDTSSKIHSVMVEFHKFRKVVKVVDFADVKDLIEVAYASCPVKLPEHFNLQYFDSTFNEFIDLDDVLTLEDSVNLLKVIEIYPLSSTYTSILDDIFDNQRSPESTEKERFVYYEHLSTLFIIYICLHSPIR